MGMDTEQSIASIELSGADSAYFRVDRDGSIYFTGGIELHYFITPRFSFRVTATNRYGTGEPAEVTVSISALISELTLDDLSHIRAIAISEDGQTVTIENRNYPLQTIYDIDITDLSHPVIVKTIKNGDPSTWKQFSKPASEIPIDGGKRIVVLESFEDSMITIMDSGGNAVSNQYQTDADNITLSANELYLLTGSYSALEILDISKRDEIVLETRLAGIGSVKVLAVSNDFKTAVVGGDNVLRIIDLDGF